MRLFLAGPVPEDVQATLSSTLTAARRAASQARWVQPGQLHLTLAFLGEQQPTCLSPLVDALRPVGLRHPRLRLSLHGAGCLGRPHAPKLLFAEVGGEVDGLRALTADIRSTLGPLLSGQKSGSEPFFPHLTLARARGRQGDASLRRCARALRECAFGAFVLGRFALYQSELLAEGSRYTECADFPLAASASAHP